MGRYYLQEQLNDWVRGRRTGKALSWKWQLQGRRRSADDTGNNLGEEVRDILPVLKAEMLDTSS